MHEAQARYQRADDEQETGRDRPALHAVPSEQAREALRYLERTLAAEESMRAEVRETGRGVLAEPRQRREDVARDRRTASQTRRAVRKADAERAHAAVRDLELE